MHTHNIDGTQVDCANLTHRPSFCNCAIDECDATATRALRIDPSFDLDMADADRAEYADRAACDTCGERINGYVCVNELIAAPYLCADCLAKDMGIDDEPRGYIRRTGSLWIDQVGEEN